MITAINYTDILYVTAICGGMTLISTTMSGISSLGDVFRHLRSQAVAAKGVITLQIRNGTQGWSQRHTVVFKPAAMSLQVGSESQRRDNFSYPSLFSSDD